MKIKFLVADEIRQEASGKQTVLGLFADDIIVLQMPTIDPKRPVEIPPGIDRLGFLINFSELDDGEHKFKAQLFTRSGKPYENAILESLFVTKDKKSHSIGIEMKPFIVTEPGIFDWVINIDGEEHHSQFEVRVTEQPPAKS